MIRLVVFDIDGVITDGSIIIDANGREQKKINMKDIDAIFELKRRGFMIAAVTKENTEIVTYFKQRFPWDFFYQGKAQKADTLRELSSCAGIDVEELCYIGDGKYDIEPLKLAGLGVCPADAISSAKTAADFILQAAGGQGGIWELIDILDIYNSDHTPNNYFYNRLEEHVGLLKKMASNQELVSTVMEISIKVAELFRAEGQLFFYGYGESANDAQHMANEIIGKYPQNCSVLNTEISYVNNANLTSVSNDKNYESMFVRQLQTKAKPGDMLFILTNSGKSKNLIEDLKYLKEEGIITIMLTGDFENPELFVLCDYIIKVPSKHIPRIQEAHTFIGHTLVEYVEFIMLEEDK